MWIKMCLLEVACLRSYKQGIFEHGRNLIKVVLRDIRSILYDLA